MNCLRTMLQKPIRCRLYQCFRHLKDKMWKLKMSHMADLDKFHHLPDYLQSYPHLDTHALNGRALGWLLRKNNKRKYPMSAQALIFILHTESKVLFSIVNRFQSHLKVNACNANSNQAVSHFLSTWYPELMLCQYFLKSKQTDPMELYSSQVLSRAKIIER